MNVGQLETVRSYNDSIPQFLRNRPVFFFEHCCKRISPAIDAIPRSNINEAEPGIYIVCRGSGHKSYVVRLHSEASPDIPSCECFDWQRHCLPCKHLLAVLLCLDESNGWDQLPLFYRSIPQFVLDRNVLEAQRDVTMVSDSQSTATATEIRSAGNETESTATAAGVPSSGQETESTATATEIRSTGNETESTATATEIRSAGNETESTATAAEVPSSGQETESTATAAEVPSSGQETESTATAAEVPSPSHQLSASQSTATVSETQSRSPDRNVGNTMAETDAPSSVALQRRIRQLLQHLINKTYTVDDSAFLQQSISVLRKQLSEFEARSSHAVSASIFRRNRRMVKANIAAAKLRRRFAVIRARQRGRARRKPTGVNHFCYHVDTL